MEVDSATEKPVYPALLIDGSGTEIFTGIIGEDGSWLSTSGRAGTPLEAMFPAVETCLKEAGLQLAEIKSYIYNKGPGSVLGLRLCAMAIETWTRLYSTDTGIFAYNTLEYCAHQIRLEHTIDKACLLVSDWKKGAWNALEFGPDQLAATTVINDATLADFDGPVYHLPQRKGWQSPPANAVSIAINLTRFPQLLKSSNFVQMTESVELYASAVNTFQKWTPERHRAPA